MITQTGFGTITRTFVGAMLLAGAFAACTTQEATTTPTGTGGTTTPTGGNTPATGGTTAAVGSLGTLCPMPKEVITDFTFTPSDAGLSTSAPRFGSGSGTLQGGGSFYPDSGTQAIQSDLTQGNWHFSGTVSNYSGFSLYFDLCDRLDASAFKGISFTVSGNVPAITFGIGTVDNTPTGAWMLTTGGKKTAKETDAGKCTPTSGTEYYHPGCTSSETQIPVTSTAVTQTITWSTLAGGTPVASVNPKEITSIYWFFPWTDKSTPYAFDFTIDDLKFIP